MPSRIAWYVSAGVRSLTTMCTEGSDSIRAEAMARSTWAPTRSASNTPGRCGPLCRSAMSMRQRRAEHPDLAIDVGDALGRAGERLEALHLVRQDRDAIELLLQRCQSLVEPGLELVGRRRLVGAPLAPQDWEDS